MENAEPMLQTNLKDDRGEPSVSLKHANTFVFYRNRGLYKQRPNSESITIECGKF